MFHAFRSFVRSCLRRAAGSLYHILVLVLSAGTALMLPSAATHFLSFWERVEHHPWSLVAAELAVAVLLMTAFNHLRGNAQARRLAAMATGAGLVAFFPHRATDAQSRIAVLQEEQGPGRTVLAIGSSGASTFADRVGDLSSVLDRCLGARIMLVNPCSSQVQARFQAGAHPAHGLSAFREEVRQSIAHLKRLKAIGKDVRLKLYDDPPIIKMMILGDYLWLQHYHAELDAQTMPEYVVRRHRALPGLYTLYAHYFTQRWENAQIPEYDLDRDELVYRDHAGAELRREPFADLPPLMETGLAPRIEQAPHGAPELVHIGEGSIRCSTD